jgi:uncharacterized membrane protein
MATMDSTVAGKKRGPMAARIGSVGLLLPAALVVAAWLMLTPGGLLGKADAIGYAVCHRIDIRSFHLGSRALPLCARCSGMYLGALVGMGGLVGLGRLRHGRFPRPTLLAVFGLFAAAWAIDGVNSYLTLIPGAPHAYEPNNTLRLITGTLMGLTLGMLVFTGFNQNAWRDWKDEPVLRSLPEVGLLLLLGAVVVALVLTENPLVLYPLALLSAAGVLVLLGMVYGVVVLLVLRRENRAQSWGGLALPLVAGVALAILQIGLLDLARYTLTGTWGGFAL